MLKQAVFTLLWCSVFLGKNLGKNSPKFPKFPKTFPQIWGKFGENSPKNKNPESRVIAEKSSKNKAFWGIWGSFFVNLFF